MFKILLLLATGLMIASGQDPEDSIIASSKTILHYIHKDKTKETKWTVQAVINDILDAINSVNPGETVAPCEENLKGYLIELFRAIDNLEGNRTLVLVYNIIENLTEESNYLLSGSLQLTGQAVQEIVGILIGVVVNTLNSIRIFDVISQYLIEVYKTNIKVIHRISMNLLERA